MARISKKRGLCVIAGLTALLAAGCAATSASGQPSASPASPAHASATSTGHGSAAIGKAYPYVLSIHCGVRPLSFDGRAWEAVTPIPKYPLPRPVNGLVTETGFVNGTLMLTATDTLRFTADIRHVMTPFVVTFKPFVRAAPVTLPACG
jgi:hypothetical protein